MPPVAGIPVRKAVREEAAALVAPENAAFEIDRLSLHALIEASTVRLRGATIDDCLAGPALTMRRKGTGVARLCSIARNRADRGKGVAAMLLLDSEDGACQSEPAVTCREFVNGNDAPPARIRRGGYHLVEQLPAYPAGGSDGLRLEKPVREAEAPETLLDGCEQTAEFTFGAGCLMIVLGAVDLAFPLDSAIVVRPLREATTGFRTSAPG